MSTEVVLDKGTVTEAIAEHSVLAELLRREFPAFLAHGRTQAAWDILLVRSASDLLRIQVKGIGHQSSVRMDVNALDFDFLVIVDTRISLNDVDTSATMRYFILSAKEVLAAVSDLNTEKEEASNIRYINVPKEITKPVMQKALYAWSKLNAPSARKKSTRSTAK